MNREALIEQVAGAWRARTDAGGATALPAWHDLDVAGRREAHEIALVSRRLEAAADPRGLSSTGKAVLARIRLARAAP